MVRKIASILCVCVLLVGAFCTQANAATHTIYEEGTLSSTYTTYFKDIIAGAKFTDNYVAFRSGQYSYSMVVGELEYKNGAISLVGSGKEYKYSATTSGYNQQYKYTVSNLSNFSVDCGDYIIYSDVGDFPQLVERGAKYEMLQTLLIWICCLSIVIARIFYNRKR